MAGLASLNKAAGGGRTTPKRKSIVPVCSVTAGVSRAMDAFSKAKTDLENAKARKADAEVQMMNEAHELRLNACLESGKLHASVKLSGKEDNTLTFTQKSQCLKMFAENCEDKIRGIVNGDEDFDRYFEEKGNYVIDEKALMALPNADEVAEAIVEALGENAHILTRESVITPTDQFYNDKVFDKRVSRMAEQLEDEGLVVPHKASFK